MGIRSLKIKILCTGLFLLVSILKDLGKEKGEEELGYIWLGGCPLGGDIDW